MARLLTLHLDCVLLSPLRGLRLFIGAVTHSLRCGLHSCAPSELLSSRLSRLFSCRSSGLLSLRSSGLLFLRVLGLGSWHLSGLFHAY